MTRNSQESHESYRKSVNAGGHQYWCPFFVRPSDYRPNGLTLVGLDPTPHFTSRYCQM